MIKSIFLGLFSLKLVFLMLIFNIPGQVYAGIFSLVSNPSYTESAERYLQSTNSQNLALMRADLSPDLAFSSDDETELKVVDGLAFSPQIGAILESEPSLPSARGGSMVTTHEVRDGETISSIAQKYDISQRTILWENGLTSNSVITPGQKLTILPFDGVRHEVKKGDTLSEIAELYDVSLKEITDFNRFDADDFLIPGNKINIPGGERKQTSQRAPSPAPSRPAPQATPQQQSAPQPASGYFRAPLDNYRITQGLHSYNAVDMAAPSGTPIRAAAEGTVTESSSGWNGGYGTMIVISHPNGTRTLYSHNRVNYVSVGEWVEQGQVIGEVGSTGLSTGPHVHFEVHNASNPFR